MAIRKSKKEDDLNLLQALDLLTAEKHISKEVLLETIENSLISACKNHFGTAENIEVKLNELTGSFVILQEKEIVEKMEEHTTEYEAKHIALADAVMIDRKLSVGDKVRITLNSREFGRIATGNAKNVILQKIREEERRELFNEFFAKEKDIITGIVQRRKGKLGRNIDINLGRCDGVLHEMEQVKSEDLQPTERVKVYVMEVKEDPKGPKIILSRSHPELVKRLFETEVSEIRDGVVEIKAIAREAGSRTKMAVMSYDENVDPVGACVGLNGARVNAVVEELRGEKIDIIEWNENAGYFIEAALSPAQVIAVLADEEIREAQVIVPDYQLSLAIGKEGQNARLAAKLTNFKIDIKSETQAREMGIFDELNIDFQEEGAIDYERVEGGEDTSDDFEGTDDFDGLDDFDAIEDDVVQSDVDEESHADMEEDGFDFIDVPDEE